MSNPIKICKTHYRQLPDSDKSGNYELVKRNYYCEQCKSIILEKQRQYSLNYYQKNKEYLNKNPKRLIANAKFSKKNNYKHSKIYAKKNRIFLNLIERARRRGLKLYLKKLIADKNYYNESINKINQLEIIIKLPIDKEYYKKYYAKNREKILEKRKLNNKTT